MLVSTTVVSTRIRRPVAMPSAWAIANRNCPRLREDTEIRTEEKAPAAALVINPRARDRFEQLSRNAADFLVEPDGIEPTTSPCQSAREFDPRSASKILDADPCPHWVTFPGRTTISVFDRNQMRDPFGRADGPGAPAPVWAKSSA